MFGGSNVGNVFLLGFRGWGGGGKPLFVTVVVMVRVLLREILLGISSCSVGVSFFDLLVGVVLLVVVVVIFYLGCNYLMVR